MSLLHEVGRGRKQQLLPILDVKVFQCGNFRMALEIDPNVTVLCEGDFPAVEAKLVIKNFGDMMTLNPRSPYIMTPGKSISSKFKLGDSPMTIHVYPNGYSKATSGMVLVCLVNNGDETLALKGQIVTDVSFWRFSGLYQSQAIINSEGFLFHSVAKLALADAETVAEDTGKDFVVRVTVQKSDDELQIIGTESADAVPKKFGVWKKVYGQMKDANFTLVFNGVEVPCHKHVLAAASPVFEAMLEGQNKEASENRATIELSEDVGIAFVRFIYTGELEEGVLRDEVVAFLELGDKYDFQDLKDLAEVEMLKQLNTENMVEFLSLGDHYNAKRILEAALKLTKANMCGQVFDGCYGADSL